MDGLLFSGEERRKMLSCVIVRSLSKSGEEAQEAQRGSESLFWAEMDRKKKMGDHN